MALRSDAPLQVDKGTDVRALVQAQDLVRHFELGEASTVDLSTGTLDDLIEEYSIKFADHAELLDGHVREGDESAKKLTELLEDQTSQHGQLTQLHRDEMDAIRTEFEADKAALITSYSEELKLRSVSSYWAQKAKTHRIGFWFWTALFFGVATGGTTTLVYYGTAFVLDVASTSEAIPLSNLVVITIPALIFFWIMRMLSRFVVNNLRRADDANERRMMINTYLALLAKAETQVTEDERVLLLNAIFRPGPGDAKDDGETSLLTELLRSQRGSASG